MSNSVLHAIRYAALAASMALSAGAFAAPVTYEFTTVDGHYGSFSYNDAQPTPQPSSTQVVRYDLLSFSLDGVSLANPILQLSNNSFWELADFVQINALGSGVELYFRADLSLFSSYALAEFNGRTLSDFIGTRFSTSSSSSSLATLTQVASIPEPGTSALMVLGLVAVLAARRARSSDKASTKI
ncbi:PEP-CTERM sorting domain-containing protein [Aquabacterium soli]|jgi:hypothetical protein|uniref:PEP-CTERM sorting domain-containing protein n=1 Tax=Aquabacterium soli TaxID=2493092 RepID=A0A3R8TFD5_9BURK|nr:PEP-CTERM sorting domain-containing protein [Aquabacterium soli]RRS06382.1 PEP-CTERM sorting domain-containing protein [Aquabacterium soli]